MREPDETELAGLKRLLAWFEKQGCEEITGKDCEAILSDECLACIDLSGAQAWLHEVIEDTKSEGRS